MKKLSDKPSKILIQALEDLIAVENSPKFVIDMGDWVVGAKHTDSKKCEVCHAGASMVQRYGCETGFGSYGPGEFNNQTSAKFRFINCVRVGQIISGLMELEDAGVISDEEFDKAEEFIGDDFITYNENTEFERSEQTLKVPDDVQDYIGKRNRDKYKQYILTVAGVLKAIGL